MELRGSVVNANEQSVLLCLLTKWVGGIRTVVQPPHFFELNLALCYLSERTAKPSDVSSTALHVASSSSATQNTFKFAPVSSYGRPDFSTLPCSSCSVPPIQEKQGKENTARGKKEQREKYRGKPKKARAHYAAAVLSPRRGAFRVSTTAACRLARTGPAAGRPDVRSCTPCCLCERRNPPAAGAAHSGALHSPIDAIVIPAGLLDNLPERRRRRR